MGNIDLILDYFFSFVLYPMLHMPLSLTGYYLALQLLDTGFFHADPHPGNMIRTPDGKLAILDFGKDPLYKSIW